MEGYCFERRSRSDCVHEQVAKRIANVRSTADKHSPATGARSTKRWGRGDRRYGGKNKKTASGADADGLVSSGDRADSCGRWLTGAGSRYVQ